MSATNYFKFFNKVIYDGRVVTDLSNRFKIKNNKVLLKSKVYQPYIIKEGETPESIAEAYYGSTTFFWIILLANDIFNIYEDWPKPINIFNDYMVEKYGDLEFTQTEIHHFEDDTGAWISEEDWDGTESKKISYYDYENNLNQKRKEIFLIDKIYLKQIMKEFKSIFK